EFRDYLEVTLSRNVFMVAPGIGFIFATSDAEQRFIVSRYRRRGLSRTLTHVHRPSRPRSGATANRTSAADARAHTERKQLESLWSATLELGRYPEADEVPDCDATTAHFGSVNKALRKLATHFDGKLLEAAARLRADELSLTLA